MEKELEIMQTLLSDFKDMFFEIYLAGSHKLSFINNPKDCDIIIISETEEQSKELKRLFYEKYSRKEFREKYNYDLHFISDYREQEIFNRTAHYPYITYIKYDVYNNNFEFKETRGISLEDFIANKDKYKERYLYLIDEWIESLKRRNKEEHFYDIKIFYYMYTTLSILNNKSFELTEEQIENINILHDRKEEDLEKRKELITKLIEDVKEI